MINLTDIRVKVVNKEGNLRAIASICVENAIVIHNIKLIEKPDGGLIISFPCRKDDATDKYLDIVHPISKELREYIQQEVINKYNEKLKVA